MSGQTRARISALTKSRAPQLALVHSPVLVPANKTLAAAARRARHSSSVIARAARRRQIGQGIGAAAAQRNDMVAFERLVCAAIDAGVSVALQHDAANDVPVTGRELLPAKGANMLEAPRDARLNGAEQRQVDFCAV